MDYPDRPSVILRVLIRGRQESQSQRGDIIMEAKGEVMHFENVF